MINFRALETIANVALKWKRSKSKMTVVKGGSGHEGFAQARVEKRLLLRCHALFIFILGSSRPLLEVHYNGINILNSPL